MGKKGFLFGLVAAKTGHDETTSKLKSLPHEHIGDGIYLHKPDDRHFYFNKDNHGNAKDLSVINKNNVQIS